MIEEDLNYLKEKYNFDDSDLKIIADRIKELNKSIKKVQSIEVKESLASVNSILNLWAPVAFAFDEPVALSNRDESSVDVTKVSDIVSPTR